MVHGTAVASAAGGTDGISLSGRRLSAWVLAMRQAEKTGLTRNQLVAYSLGGLAMNLTNLVVSEWLFDRYVIGGVLSASIFSGILLAGRFTDGVSDLLVAFWTDNTRSPRGRRIPFPIYCVFPFAIVCFLLWTSPAEASASVRVVFSIAVTQLFFLGYALVVTPYLALLPEIARSTDQRLNLTTGQAIDRNAGIVGGF